MSIRARWPAFAQLLVICLCWVSSSPAWAVPSFARQTGMACSACHTVFPELTPFGREFKLSGYVLDNVRQVTGVNSDNRETLALNALAPLSIMLQISYTHTTDAVPDSTLANAYAKDGDVLIPGKILLAPGDRHLLVRRQGSRLVAHISDTPPENYCRPAVDPMLRSACEAMGGRVLVAMLTGMGQDGLLGTRKIIESGGALVAQDEASSVVWGMPGAVVRAGLAHAVLPLPQIGAKLMAMLGAGPITGLGAPRA